VDPEKLAEMRAYAAELRAEIAEREAQVEDDPIGGHDALMATLRTTEQTRSAPTLVFKTHENDASAYDNTEPASIAEPDEITEAVMVLQDTVLDLQKAQDQIAQRLLVLETQFQTLMNLMGADANRSKAMRKRLQDDARFIEAPRHPS
jgi:hypothetical protein